MKSKRKIILPTHLRTREGEEHELWSVCSSKPRETFLKTNTPAKMQLQNEVRLKRPASKENRKKKNFSGDFHLYAMPSFISYIPAFLPINRCPAQGIGGNVLNFGNWLTQARNTHYFPGKLMDLTSDM